MKFCAAAALPFFCLCLCSVLTAQSGDDAVFNEKVASAQKALQEHKYKEAVDALKNANRMKHDSCGECYYLLGVAYSRLRDQRKAMDSCDKAIETASNDSLRALSHNLKGTLLFNSADEGGKNFHLAESEYRTAVQLAPKSAPFHLNLAKALLRESKDDTAKQELQVCLDCAPDQNLKAEAQKLLENPALGRADLAPEFQLTTLAGQQLSLHQLAGRIVVMDFWATWCPPCRESVPELKDLARRYPGEKLVLISVSADSDENAWREFVEKKKMDWAQYRDSTGNLREAFGVRSFPTYLVIDATGIIQQRLTGLNPRATIVHRLKEVLSQMPQLEGEARK